jgi:C1A family cysteine protease
VNATNGITPRRIQRYGWVPDIPDARDFMYSAPEPVLAKLPRKVDLRQQCPAVYDQGQLGSCTANAIGGAFEFDQRKQKLDDFMPSRLFIYYNERAMEGTIDTDSGAMIRDGIKSVAKLGVCPESDWDYDIARFRDPPPQQAYEDALEHQVVVYRRVLNRLHQMQACLAQGYPFVFGFTVYESFESDEVARTGIVPLPPRTEKVLGGHAVVAVGYDDAKQWFVVRNSWGPDWGEHGYCYMPYTYLSDPQLASDFWAIYSVEPSANGAAAH